MNQKTIIELCRRGDRKAQRVLYDTYRSRWYMICLRYLRGESDAQDALQNALVKIYMKIDQFDLKLGSFYGWSSRIVVNECIMLIRSRKRVLEFESMEGSIDFNLEPSVIEDLSAQEILKLVQKLPTGYRLVFNLHAMEGYAHHEIAEMLQISTGTSKSQLFKARKMLQQQIKHILLEPHTHE
ncbi:MAG: RNA polymerase sigma factor [Saprospiraceae bacterium]|nr:RNA polymerase sigma factor [Saprospiraceae bacterium]